MEKINLFKVNFLMLKIKWFLILIFLYKMVLEKPHLVLQILSCFSAYTNTMKLFTVKKMPGQIDCLHSIRFLSIAW